MVYTKNTTQPSKLLFLNSEHAHHYSHDDAEGNDQTSSFEVSLAQSIACHNDSTHMVISLTEAAIPASFYSCNRHNNKVVFTHSSTSYEKSIDPGNYSANAMMAKLNTLLSGHFTVTFSDTTNRFTFTGAGGASIALDFTAEGSAFRLLGFRKSYNQTKNIHTSDTVADMTGGLNNLFIRSSLASNHAIDSLNRGGGSIMAKVPVNVDHFGIIHYQESTSQGFQALVPTKDVRSFTLRLTDEYGNQGIDLNGLHWSCTLKFDFVDGLQRPTEEPHARDRVREHMKQNNPKLFMRSEMHRKMRADQQRVFDEAFTRMAAKNNVGRM